MIWDGLTIQVYIIELLIYLLYVNTIYIYIYIIINNNKSNYNSNI